MSIDAMRTIAKSALAPSGRKFVALALADYADEAWECFPQVKAIAAYTAQSERTVREHLDALEAAGIIVRKRVRRADGTLGGYRFAIQQDALPAKPASGEKQPLEKSATGEKPNEINPAAVLASGEKPQQPAAKISTTSGEICRALTTKGSIKEDPPISLVQAAPSRASRFPEFWDLYPHRDGKRNRADAEKRYRKAVASGVPEQTIIDGAVRSKSDRRVIEGFARDPTTWLNQRGWEDEIAPAEAHHLQAIQGSPSNVRPSARNHSVEATEAFLAGARRLG